jgi:hypothetical protein
MTLRRVALSFILRMGSSVRRDPRVAVSQTATIDEIHSRGVAMTKWVYAFDEVDQAEEHVGGSWDGVRGLLGGKGANLAEMTRIEVPVPPGFTITTGACNAYLAAGEEFPDGLWDQVLSALKGVEERTAKTFGDPSNPLLVSCRSGAKFSMPGMMTRFSTSASTTPSPKGWWS